VVEVRLCSLPNLCGTFRFFFDNFRAGWRWSALTVASELREAVSEHALGEPHPLNGPCPYAAGDAGQEVSNTSANIVILAFGPNVHDKIAYNKYGLLI
jgi:hypothetical protein